MPKRGAKLPWRVYFEWSNGIKGTRACYSRDDAEMYADQIRRAGESRSDASVTVVIEHAPSRRDDDPVPTDESIAAGEWELVHEDYCGYPDDCNCLKWRRG